jgi:hypothetical protein
VLVVGDFPDTDWRDCFRESWVERETRLERDGSAGAGECCCGWYWESRKKDGAVLFENGFGGPVGPSALGRESTLGGGGWWCAECDGAPAEGWPG